MALFKSSPRHFFKLLFEAFVQEYYLLHYHPAPLLQFFVRVLEVHLFVCGVCCVIVWSSSLLLVPREGRALWLCYFLGSFLHNFGSIACNRPTVCKRENFLKVVVCVIITDQCNQTGNVIQVTVIYNRAVLVTVTSECRAKRVICKI